MVQDGPSHATIVAATANFARWNQQRQAWPLSTVSGSASAGTDNPYGLCNGGRNLMNYQPLPTSEHYGPPLFLQVFLENAEMSEYDAPLYSCGTDADEDIESGETCPICDQGFEAVPSTLSPAYTKLTCGHRYHTNCLCECFNRVTESGIEAKRSRCLTCPNCLKVLWAPAYHHARQGGFEHLPSLSFDLLRAYSSMEKAWVSDFSLMVSTLLRKHNAEWWPRVQAKLDMAKRTGDPRPLIEVLAEQAARHDAFHAEFRSLDDVVAAMVEAMNRQLRLGVEAANVSEEAWRGQDLFHPDRHNDTIHTDERCVLPFLHRENQAAEAALRNLRDACDHCSDDEASAERYRELLRSIPGAEYWADQVPTVWPVSMEE